MAGPVFTQSRALAGLLPPSTHGTGNEVNIHFDNTTDFYAFTSGKHRKADAWTTQFWQDRASFCGETNTKLEQIGRDGWADGAGRVAKIRDVLIASRPAAPKIARYDVAGALPSVPRALAGNPMNMRRIVSAPSSRSPVLTLVMDVAIPAYVEPECLVAAAVGACAIVDVLEGAGFRAEIIACFRSTTLYQKASRAANVAVRVKSADQSVVLPTLSFALGHPGFLRLFMFRAFALTREASYISENMGYPETTAPSVDMPGVFVLPGAKVLKTEDPATAMRLQIAALREQGCPGIPGDDETN